MSVCTTHSSYRKQQEQGNPEQGNPDKDTEEVGTSGAGSIGSAANLPLPQTEEVDEERIHCLEKQRKIKEAWDSRQNVVFQGVFKITPTVYAASLKCIVWGEKYCQCGSENEVRKKTSIYALFICFISKIFSQQFMWKECFVN